MFYVQYIRSVLHGHFKRQQEKGRKRGSEIVRFFLKVVVGNPADRSKIKILQALFFFLFSFQDPDSHSWRNILRTDRTSLVLTADSGKSGLSHSSAGRALGRLFSPSPHGGPSRSKKESVRRGKEGVTSVCVHESRSLCQRLSLRRLTPTVTIGPSAGVNCSTVHW